MENILKSKKFQLLFLGIIGLGVLIVFFYEGIRGKYFVSLAIIFLFSMFFHYCNIKKSSNHLLNLLGIDRSKNRNLAYDYLRVLATLFVILTHAIQADIAYGPVPTKDVLVLTLIYTLTLSCNLIFIMVSGALLLRDKNESTLDFYLKRIIKVVVPMFIYYLFYMWKHQQLQILSFNTILNVLKTFLVGNFSVCPHYWFFYMIISLYVFVPFLRYLMKNISYKVLSEMVLVSLIFMTLNILPINFAFNSPFGAHLGVMIIGYWLSLSETRKYDKKILIMSLIATFSLISIGVVIREKDSFLAIVADCSPIMCFISMGIFICAILINKNDTRKHNLLMFISKYSYSILLLHWGILYYVVRGYLHINITSYNYFGIIVSLISTLAVSAVGAFVVDNCIIFPILQIFKCLVKKRVLK